MTNLDVEIADWREWLELGTRLSLCAGVHAPSAFSALLSSTMSSCAGLTVIDAGSGAGLVTIAALLGGATQVIAIDNDPAALRVTAHNVAEVLGPAGTDRLTTLELDFADLGGVSADLLAVNPPQRPARILSAVEPDQRHLHEGGGEDGLHTLRLVLAHATTATVRTTAAGALAIADLQTERWAAPTLVTRQLLPLHPAWAELDEAADQVGVWEFDTRS